MIKQPPGSPTTDEHNIMHKKWAMWFAHQAAYNASNFCARHRLFEIARGFSEIADFIAEEMKQTPDPHPDHPPLRSA